MNDDGDIVRQMLGYIEKTEYISDGSNQEENWGWG